MTLQAFSVCRRAVLVCLLSVIAIGFWTPAEAQLAKPTRPFSHIVADWNATFTNIERYLAGTTYLKSTSEAHRRSLAEISDQAEVAKENAARGLEDVRGLLAALGDVPKEGEPVESEAVAERRAQYDSDLVFYRTRLQQAELALARAGQLDSRLAEIATRKLVGQLLTQLPTPVETAALSVVVGDVTRAIRALLGAPAAWWRSLPSAQQHFGQGFRVVAVLIVVVGIGWAVRQFLLRQFGKDPAVEGPSYTRRLISAIAEGVARGIVPALFFAGIMLRSVSDASLIGGLFGEIIFGICAGMIVFVTATALIRATLSPRLPAWQLVPLVPENAVRISRNVTALAAVTGIDIFCRLLFDDLAMSPEFRSVYSAVSNTAGGVLLVTLCRPTLWEAPPQSATDETEPAAPHADRMWRIVRIILGVTIFISIAASWTGYGRLGDFINENLVASLIAASLLYLLRGLLRELVGVGMRSELLRDRLAVSHASRSTAKFWLRLGVDGLFILAGLILIAPFWGVPHEELWRWSHAVLTGFNVGSVRISLLDTMFGIVVFIGLMLATRMMQRVLSDRVLPQTQLEPGIQHSVAAGFGYVGIVIAAALGITVLGVDLSNLAIIAGALSVGIGFGLQNIVNNFVSGLILLIERPIKVGDWVVVGGNEGLVRRISVRATEIQTFQRASVIAPNAEFLSNSLTNWTHKDRNGRIEIAVGVAYGSDTKRVEEILLEIANSHEEVVADPEPFVIFMNFGGSSLDFELRCYTLNVMRRLRIASALRFQIDEAFREAGIEIPFPQRIVHMAPPVEL